MEQHKVQSLGSASFEFIPGKWVGNIYNEKVDDNERNELGKLK